MKIYFLVLFMVTVALDFLWPIECYQNRHAVSFDTRLKGHRIFFLVNSISVWVLGMIWSSYLTLLRRLLVRLSRAETEVLPENKLSKILCRCLSFMLTQRHTSKTKSSLFSLICVILYCTIVYASIIVYLEI